MAVPMLSAGALIGVIAVETAEPFSSYDDVDERVLSIVAGLTAKSIVVERALAGEANDEEPTRPLNGEHARRDVVDGPRCHIRHFTGDGSTFIDDDYVIRGVAGRLLWKLAEEYVESGRIEFTNREARLDPLLQLPEYRDNFESRLILLKRRLDERRAALRIVSTARGRFPPRRRQTARVGAVHLMTGKLGRGLAAPSRRRASHVHSRSGHADDEPPSKVTRTRARRSGPHERGR